MQSCLTTLLILTLGCVLAAESTPPTSEPDARPNILFCMADDWGWPHAGVYGDAVVKTPSFDRLAQEGVLFANAYISSPSCTPSRNAVLTGQQFYRLGHGANLWSTLDVSQPNFMRLLEEAGYQTGHWRKAWGPGSYQVGGYETHPCGPKGSFDDFMQQRDRSRPFCFWFGTSDPHRGYEKGSGAKSGIAVDDVHVPAFYPNTEVIRSDIADYYFEVQRWDSDVGEAIALLEAAGELENTIIVMTGDHGMPFPRCKGNLYDWGSRVPLAIRWGAQVPAKRTVTDMTSLTDLAPTFLEAAGLAIPPVMTGRSLMPILREGGTGHIDATRDFMVYGRERHTPAQADPSSDGYPSRALRTDHWLLILNLEPERWPSGVPEGATHRSNIFTDVDGGPTKDALMAMKDDLEHGRFYELSFAKRGPVELYDCRTDPDQVHNLANDPEHQETIATLRAQLVEYLQATGDPRFTDAPVLFDEYPYLFKGKK